MSDPLPIDPADIQMDLAELSPCERRLVFDVPARQAKRFHKKLKKSGEDASPEETARHLTNFCIEQGLKRFDIKPIWGPIPTPGVDTQAFRAGFPFSLSIDVDDSPEVEWPDFSTLEIIRPVRSISDEMIDAEMREQCRDAGKKAQREGEIQQDDDVVFRVTLTEEGSDAPLYVQEQARIRVPGESGTASIFDIQVDGLASKIIGCDVGDTVRVEATVPDEYIDPTLCGADVLIEMQILEASSIEPATVEEVLKQYGSPNESILRQQIRMALDSKATRDQHTVIAGQVFEQLANSTDIPLPQRVETDFCNSVAASAQSAMERRGCSKDAIEQRLAEKEDRIRTIGIQLARRRAISNLLCHHFEIQIGEEELIGQIAELAAEQGRRPEDLRKEIMATGRLHGVSVTVMERKSVETLLEQVTLTDMPAEEWAQRKGDAQPH